jgi:hypothetical protein
MTAGANPGVAEAEEARETAGEATETSPEASREDISLNISVICK